MTFWNQLVSYQVTENDHDLMKFWRLETCLCQSKNKLSILLIVKIQKFIQYQKIILLINSYIHNFWHSFSKMSLSVITREFFVL